MRRADTREPITFGKSKYVAARMSSLHLDGTGTRNNTTKRTYVTEHLAQLEYRTIAFATEQDAFDCESALKAAAKKAGKPYLFPK